MALLTNYTRLETGQGRLLSAGINPVAWKKTGRLRMSETQDDVGNDDPYQSLPAGTEPPYSFQLATEGGELSSSIDITGTGAVTGTMILTRDLAASLSGTGDLSGSLALLTALTATLDGTSSVSADLALLIALAAELAGIGAVDTSSNLKLQVSLDTLLAGTASIAADLVGYASLEANIYVNSGTATTQEIVAAVWDAVAADYDTSGSMGEKLNGAGSAGNPWTEVIESGLTAKEAMQLIAAALVGTVSGAGTSTIEFRAAVADHKARITATTDVDGNRTSITTDTT